MKSLNKSTQIDELWMDLTKQLGDIGIHARKLTDIHRVCLIGELIKSIEVDGGGAQRIFDAVLAILNIYSHLNIYSQFFMKHTILLIWEEIPESIKIFLLEDLTQEQYLKICAAHGTYLNSNATDDTKWLNNFLYTDEGELKIDAVYQTESEVKPFVIDKRYTIVVSGYMV